MAQTATDVLYANMQVVRQNVLPRLYELSNYVSAKIIGGIEKHQISKTPNSQDFRAPIETGNTAIFGTWNMAGGSLGLGGSFQTQQLVQTAVPLKLGFQLNRDAVWSTNDKALSVVNAFKKSVKDAPELFARYDDTSFFNITGSQGVIGVATGVNSQTYTLDTNFGANLLMQGQSVEVFDSTLATDKTNNAGLSPDSLPKLSAVDKINRTVTLDSIGGMSLAATDKLLFAGVATTPTWINGLYYFNDSSTSGSYLGLTRSSYPELIANGYDAGSNSLTPQMGLLIKHRIFLRRGQLPKGLVGIMNIAQHAALLNQGINISNWFRGKGMTDKMIDIMPTVEDVVDFCGIPTYLSPHASQTRVDFLDRSKMGRVTFGQNAVDFYEDLEGKRFFPVRSSNGGVSASDLFYLVAVQNFYNVDPGSGGFIQNLSLPTGY